ncbi:hypothetical protein EON63_17285 [archaeon]|nr:MAG: hypothetical protein EON63_17285 [archaeon]
MVMLSEVCVCIHIQVCATTRKMVLLYIIIPPLASCSANIIHHTLHKHPKTYTKSNTKYTIYHTQH